MNDANTSGSNKPLPPGFESMEIEAKFVISDLQAYEELKALHGKRLEEYRVLFRYEAMFVDTYYDTDTFDIYHNDWVLRARRRYRDPQATIPRDARFQGKDAAKVIDAVFFRNETQGKRSRDSEEWDSFLEAQLRSEAQDRAVMFIREFAELNDKPLAPVLEVRDVRYRLFLSKDNQLLYEISLDRLQFVGLTGTQGSQYVYECELESISANTKENVLELIRLSDYLLEKYKDKDKLTPSPASKYQRGYNAVVREG